MSTLVVFDHCMNGLLMADPRNYYVHETSRTAPQSPSAQSGKTIKRVYLTRSGLSIVRRSTAASSVRRRI